MFFVLIRFGVIWFWRTKIYGIYITLLIVDLLMHAGCWCFVFLNCWCPGVHCCWWTLLLVPWCWCTMYTAYTVYTVNTVHCCWCPGVQASVAAGGEVEEAGGNRLRDQTTLLRAPLLLLWCNLPSNTIAIAFSWRCGVFVWKVLTSLTSCLLKRYHYQTTLLHWPSPSRGYYYGHVLVCF